MICWICFLWAPNWAEVVIRICPKSWDAGFGGIFLWTLLSSIFNPFVECYGRARWLCWKICFVDLLGAICPIPCCHRGQGSWTIFPYACIPNMWLLACTSSQQKHSSSNSLVAVIFQLSVLGYACNYDQPLKGASFNLIGCWHQEIYLLPNSYSYEINE